MPQTRGGHIDGSSLVTLLIYSAKATLQLNQDCHSGETLKIAPEADICLFVCCHSPPGKGPFAGQPKSE